MWTDRHWEKMIENQEKVLVGGSKKTQDCYIRSALEPCYILVSKAFPGPIGGKPWGRSLPF